MDWDVGDGCVKKGVGKYHIEARDMMERHIFVIYYGCKQKYVSFDIFHIPKKVIGKKIYSSPIESCAP